MSVILGTADLAIRKPRVVLVSLVAIPLKKSSSFKDIG